MQAIPVLELARQVYSGVEDADIQPLSGGFSSQAYKVNVREPFVLLVARAGGVSVANYGNAYVVLKLLEQHGFKQAPTALWLDKDRFAIAISYFDGVAADKFSFSRNQVDQQDLSKRVIDSLFETAHITRTEYEKYCQEVGVAPLPAETQRDSARKYGTEWFSLVEASCPDKDLIEWLRPRVQRSVDAASRATCDSPRFAHSDPSNPNILIRPDGSFKLIDWDSARFHCSWATYLVGYTTHLVDFMKPYQSEIVAHVARRIGVSENDFSDQVYEYRRNAEVFDVNWAAMMMAKISTGESEGNIDDFRKIAEARIKEYEASFA